jgi:hypothetical protein
MAESGATVQEFHDNQYRDAHEPYVQQLRDHPRGFVLNLKTTKWAALHDHSSRTGRRTTLGKPGTAPRAR